jgi:hypothetical protein
MAKTVDARPEGRGTGGASAPSFNEKIRPPRTPSKTENTAVDKEDHVKERDDLSEDISTDQDKPAH